MSVVFCLLFTIYLYMGRKSYNKTYEQILEENRLRAREYYSKNKDEINKKKMEKYYALKNKVEK